MNRTECEAKIMEKFEEINEIYKQYNPNGNYLTGVIVDNCISFWNTYYDADKDTPINYWVNLNKEDNEDE